MGKREGNDTRALQQWETPISQLPPSWEAPPDQPEPLLPPRQEQTRIQGEQNQHQHSKLPLLGTFSPFFDQQSSISFNFFHFVHRAAVCVLNSFFTQPCTSYCSFTHRIRVEKKINHLPFNYFNLSLLCA